MAMDECVFWNTSHVSDCALHNLTSFCPNEGNTSAGVNGTVSLDVDITDILDSPATFFIQLVRLSLSLTLLTIIAALYNCLTVLDRNLLITATCSLYWILYFVLTAVKAALLMILIPVAHSSKRDSEELARIVNQIGFIITTILQAGLGYTLFLALDHERRFRSPDHAAIDGPPDKCCSGLRLSRLVCSKWKVVVLVLALVPLALLVAIEIVFATNNGRLAPSPLVWVFMASLLIVRVVIVITAVQIVFLTKGNSQPTILAKLFLIGGCLLSIFEDLPNSLLSVAIYMFYPHPGLSDHCLLYEMTVYDLVQLVGILSLVPFTLFIRAQYLRIDQECKLVLLWDMQKLLQVNGRKDFIRHYNT